MINTSLILMDGVILSVLFGVYVGGTLLWKPRIWLHDFPLDIQALTPPKTDQEKRLSTLLTIPFFILLFGGLGLTAARYGTAHGFLGMVLHVYLIWQMINLFDLVVLDWGMSMHLVDPQNPPFPGTEGAKGYRDYQFYFVGFLKGCVIGIVLVLIVSGIVWVLIS
jgi:hypothetical protein